MSRQWDVVIDAEDGETLAHFAIMWGPLPEDFDQWDLVNNLGVNVASVGAMHGHLPDDFNRWDLVPEPLRLVQRLLKAKLSGGVIVVRNNHEH
jgi:hypothetical protein